MSVCEDLVERISEGICHEKKLVQGLEPEGARIWDST
jgi:hypothetical protein